MKPMPSDTFDAVMRTTRTIRRYRQEVPVSRDLLIRLVDYARLTASSSNRQPLKYLVSADPVTNATIFPHIRWAGYLSDWPGPVEGERPAAWVIILRDNAIAMDAGIDPGIAAWTISLGARAAGLGSCIFGSVDRTALTGALGIRAGLDIELAIALGDPVEEVVVEEIASGDSVKYWRDEKGVHHVPKRQLGDILVEPELREN